MNTKRGEALKRAKEIVRLMPQAMKDVKAMEQMRPALLRMVGINPNAKGCWSDANVINVSHDRDIAESDDRLLKKYMENKEWIEIVEVTIAERLNGRDADVVRDMFILHLSADMIIDKYGFSMATLWRIRKKGMEALADEILLRDAYGGACQDS